MTSKNWASLGLTTFAVEEFDALGLLDVICGMHKDRVESRQSSSAVPGEGEVEGNDGETEDALVDLFDDVALEELQEDLETAIDHVEDMGRTVKKRIDRNRTDNERLAAELRKVAAEQATAQDKAAKQFRTLERRFGRASDATIGIGSRLEQLHQAKERAAYARELLNYFMEFCFEDEITSPVFTDFPRTLPDAAGFIHDLESISCDLNMPEYDKGTARVVEKSSEILNRLLENFDKSNEDGDLTKMKLYADAILQNFWHKQGSDQLFQRYIFFSLSPLLAARKRSISFKNTALKDNLQHLFSQIRSIVRTTHVVVSRVFPRHGREILGLLVARLFTDPAFGLQTTIDDFLHPGHRGGELPHGEFIQILFTAHKETKVLVQELERGLKTAKAAFADRKFDSGEIENDADGDEGTGFDPALISKQVKVVFKVFTSQYIDKEVKLFKQKVSKEFFASVPFTYGKIVAPSLQAPPEFADAIVIEFPVAKRPSRGVRGATTAEVASPDDMLTKWRTEYKEFPARTLKKYVSVQTTDLSGLFEKIFHLRKRWQRDVMEFPIELFSEVFGLNKNWNLDDLEDWKDKEDPGTSFSASDSFATMLDDLRGLPGQSIRWAYEAHKRCMELLGNDEEDSVDNQFDIAGNMVDSDDSESLASGVQKMFQTLCDEFFLSILLSTTNLFLSHFKEITHPISRVDAASTLKALAEEQEVFADQTETQVVGLGEFKHRLNSLPALAVGNPEIKAASATITQKRKERSTSALAHLFEGKELECFIVELMAMEECLQQILVFWRDIVFPSISRYTNTVSVCQTYLENRLKLCEEALADTFDRIILKASMDLQACALSLWEKYDYSPREGTETHIDKNSTWCLGVTEILSVYLDAFSRIGNAETRKTALLKLSYTGRDAMLGILRRSKVSQGGSFTLVHDIGTMTKVFTSNPLCAKIPTIMKCWDELHLISQLFIVKPDHIKELIADKGGGLAHLRPRFLYECISRRTDFKTSFGGTAPWVKTLFHDT